MAADFSRRDFLKSTGSAAVDGLAGATHANVARFMDRVLADFLSDLKPPVVGGLAAIETAAAKAHAGAAFGVLSADQQDALLRTLQHEPWFGAILTGVRFGCEYGAKAGSQAVTLRQAVASGHCEVRPNAYVRKIEVNDAGRATGVVYFDEKGKEVFQRARCIVLPANDAETPRRRLNSKSNRFPDGLANSSGMVGKHLMFNTYATAGGVFDELLNEFKGPMVTRALWDHYDADRKRGFYGGGGMDARFGTVSPMIATLEVVNPAKPQWGVEYVRALHRNYGRYMVVATHGTSIPMPTGTIFALGFRAGSYVAQAAKRGEL